MVHGTKGIRGNTGSKLCGIFSVKVAGRPDRMRCAKNMRIVQVFTTLGES